MGKEASGKEATEEGSEEISKLMESVEDLLNQLSEDQMSRLQGLLKLHYDGDHQGRDSMLESLVIKGDEIIENLVNLVKLLEEKGAKINLLDEDEDEADDAEKNGDDDSLDENEAVENHSVEDTDDAMEDASVE